MRLGIGDVCKWAIWITWLKHNITTSSSSLPLLTAGDIWRGGSGGHGSIVLVVVDWTVAVDDAAVWEAAAAAAMALGMFGLAVEAAATVEVGATNEGGWTEDRLVGVVLAVVAGAAAAWEVAG
jgi:hypothetical protein